MGHGGVTAGMLQPCVISVCSCKFFFEQEVTERTEELRAWLSILLVVFLADRSATDDRRYMEVLFGRV